MNETYPKGYAGGAIRPEIEDATARRAIDWLCLGAAPTFAVMALLTGVVGGGGPDILCPATEQSSLLCGMAPMYLLMSAFHSPPWLKLTFSRENGNRRA